MCRLGDLEIESTDDEAGGEMVDKGRMEARV